MKSLPLFGRANGREENGPASPAAKFRLAPRLPEHEDGGANLSASQSPAVEQDNATPRLSAADSGGTTPGVWRHHLRGLLGAAMLLPFLLAAYLTAFWLRFEGQTPPRVEQWFWSTVGYVVAIKLAVFVGFRIHRSWGRFLTFSDLARLIQAAGLALLATAMAERFFGPPQMAPRAILLLDCGATIVLLGGFRAVQRAMWDRSWSSFFWSGAVPTLIVGADEAGEGALRAVLRDSRRRYRVLGFLDRDPRKVGGCLGGVPVLGTVDRIADISAKLGVKEVFLAAGDITGREVRRLAADARAAGVALKVLPSYQQLLTGRVALQPQPVSIQDLLRREPVALEMDHIRDWLRDRVLLVTGSAGSIGSEIARQLIPFAPRKLILLDRNETGQFFLERELADLLALREEGRFIDMEVVLADLLDRRRVENLLQRYRPDVIFHAAAYKHVPLMESHPGEAVKNIVFATRQLADAAESAGVTSFVMISTDKAVNPTSVMGACKRLAEMYVQSLTREVRCRFVTVRFGNVLDSAGSVVQIFRKQIAAGGPVTVTDPRMERFFMTIPEAARLVIQAGVIGRAGEILVLDMGEPVRILDLAVDMIRLSGLEVGRDIEIRYVGLRPGEKLYEELQAAGEQSLPTRHPKIRIAVSPAADLAALRQNLARLRNLADDRPGEVLQVLQDLIPGYRPDTAAPREAAAKPVRLRAA
ncbi:MAG: hypothetical protein Kow0040_05180 [Thermogutta sp.]